jgi:hypothetical protein
MNGSDYLSSQIELLNKHGTRLAAGKRLTRYAQKQSPDEQPIHDIGHASLPELWVRSRLGQR